MQDSSGNQESSLNIRENDKSNSLTSMKDLKSFFYFFKARPDSNFIEQQRINLLNIDYSKI